MFAKGGVSKELLLMRSGLEGREKLKIRRMEEWGSSSRRETNWGFPWLSKISFGKKYIEPPRFEKHLTGFGAQIGAEVRDAHFGGGSFLKGGKISQNAGHIKQG